MVSQVKSPKSILFMYFILQSFLTMFLTAYKFHIKSNQENVVNVKTVYSRILSYNPLIGLSLINYCSPVKYNQWVCVCVCVYKFIIEIALCNYRD